MTISTIRTLAYLERIAQKHTDRDIRGHGVLVAYDPMKKVFAYFITHRGGALYATTRERAEREFEGNQRRGRRERAAIKAAIARNKAAAL